MMDQFIDMVGCYIPCAVSDSTNRDIVQIVQIGHLEAEVMQVVVTVFRGGGVEETNRYRSPQRSRDYCARREDNRTTNRKSRDKEITHFKSNPSHASQTERDAILKLWKNNYCNTQQKITEKLEEYVKKNDIISAGKKNLDQVHTI
ncbi:hypothetical protein YQE_05000, partial [Dendroctonus ponderosae]